MAEHPDQLKKLATIATDMDLSAELRIKAIELLAKVGTQEALRVLLDLAANDHLIKQERDIALKYARGIIKSGR